ncbi:MAG: cytochrome c3 family protein [bacterium]
MKWQLILLLIYFCLLKTKGFAQISPGELSRPHAYLEGMTNCTKCHTFGGGADIEKCLSCHLEIKQSLESRSGYHFFVNANNQIACFKCHVEHNGRNFQLIFWSKGKDHFDHSQTGFTLLGKHLETKCKDCHQSKNIINDPRKLHEKVDINSTFLGLTPACLSCHHDEHQGQLSKECLICHTNDGWKPAVKFSHDKTKFQLTGKHNNIECVKCHPGLPISKRKMNSSRKLFFTKFVGLQFSSCTSCHQDVHRGKFGQNCKKCHDTFGWQRINSNEFNHFLTRFPLVGLHKQVACEKCHVAGKVRTKMRFANCTDCHSDIHFGQFAKRNDGGRCESCHDEFGFIPAKFDIEEHGKSSYPLTGAHLAVPCVSCHFLADRRTPRERRIFKFKDTTCQGCHQDVHKEQFALHIQKDGCVSCHQTSKWEDTLFDHKNTRFPLFGKHAQVECGKCHKLVDAGTSRERILFRPMKMACRDCHKDVHQGQFSERKLPTRCGKCHNSISWATLLFNHNKDSLFKLRGAHEKVQCNACHKLERNESIQFVRYKPIDRRCINCHG